VLREPAEEREALALMLCVGLSVGTDVIVAERVKQEVCVKECVNVADTLVVIVFRGDVVPVLVI